MPFLTAPCGVFARVGRATGFNLAGVLLQFLETSDVLSGGQ
ncbi:hypothetical protein ACGFY7_19115 [Streptomyces prunicolor]